MEFSSIVLLVIVLGYTIMPVTECQKSQHLVLSESRKTGLEGTLLQVNCTSHVTTMDSLKWIPGHDGESHIQQTYLTNTTVVMTISSLRGSDAGLYKCLLVMSDGREETAEFELMVRRKESNADACSITQFKCRRTKHCIFLRYRCDGKDDCGDGSDEDCESNPCLNKFRCNNSRCVDNQDVCNHVDNCGDLSDEGPSCVLGKLMSTTQATSEDKQFGWLKMTMSTVIACTVAVVILISFIVIVVFRVKMKRLRERRIARALDSMYRHGESREATSSGQGDEAQGDQRPFLPSGSHHYGNIIVNVNNGVQYLPGYDYSLFVAVPPPYSECGGGGGSDGGDFKPQPPPYSTIDRNNTQRQAGVNGQADSYSPRQNISVSSVQNCLGGIRLPDHMAAALPENNDKNCFAGSGNASGGSLCQGRSLVQDLESLSGITSNFLQSLLGTQYEGSSVSVDSNRNDCQALSNSVEGISTCVQRARTKTDDNIHPTENSSMLANTLKSGPDTASNSTQTMQHMPLTSTHVLAIGEDIVMKNQDLSLLNVNCDNGSSVCIEGVIPVVASPCQDMMTGHQNFQNNRVPLGVSSNVSADPQPADELHSISYCSPSANTHENSDLKI
uniref:Ig-like domain-containing protein n=1 Tax=Arion vulgaris TaxID=1028688 RepID=A0A0B6ZM58_9EUPU